MTLDASLVVLLPRFLIRVDVSDLNSATTYGQWVLKTRVQPLARCFGAFCGTFLRRGEPLACWPSNSGDRELNTQHFVPASTTGWINSETIYTPLGTRPRRMSVIGAQHFVPASNDRMDKLGNQLHAVGQKAQADVYR